MTNFVDDVKKLRDATGAGIMDAKQALSETDGDYSKALEALRNKGKAKAAKKADRETAVSAIDSYVHMGRVGVVVEVAAETDFVLKTDEFKELSHDIAMQIAATNPRYLRSESVPDAVKKDIETTTLKSLEKSDKPKDVMDKIVDGKMEKFYQEACLLSQPFIKDSDKTVAERVSEVIAKVGENITVLRFDRLEAGVQKEHE
jgi:elongation factor Ts